MKTLFCSRACFPQPKAAISLLFVLFFFYSWAQLPQRDEIPFKPTGKLNAVSGSVAGRKGEVILYWNHETRFTGYNIYRKEEGEIKFPDLPLHGKKPVQRVKTCDELTAFVKKGSDDWRLLERGFSSLQAARKSKKTDEKAPGRDWKEEQILDPRSGIGIFSKEPGKQRVDPCDALKRGFTEEESRLFGLLASGSLPLRLANGWAFIDGQAQANQRYVYQLRGVLPNQKEVLIASSDVIWVGHPRLPDAPGGISAIAGDRKVLLTWDRNPEAYSFEVRRSPNLAGPYALIHENLIQLDVTEDLNGDSLAVPRPGFADFQRWDEEGLPVPHEVGGIPVNGPENDATYFYQVASKDILGRTGPFSPGVSATPLDMTPPSAPSQLKVDPYAEGGVAGLALSWRKVVYDAMGHREMETAQTYQIYRADSLVYLENMDALTPGSPLFVTSLPANPSDPATMTVYWKDLDPALSPDFGEKDYYYRLRCVDAHGNTSSPSAVISGRVPDTKPPGATQVTNAEGFADSIRVFWKPNAEPDLGGYQIWRSLCDFGRPYQPIEENEKQKRMLPCDFVLVGQVTQSEAAAMISATGEIHFADSSVHQNAPVCYAYWVRAFDVARNLYPGKRLDQCPEPGEYICQRPYEEDAPPAPVISGLKARDNAVMIEWLSSPVQDLRAFHIYRSEKETGPPDFIGCVLSDGAPHPGRWEGLRPDCDEIPAEANPAAVRGSFLDKTARPHYIYFYRVSAVDWLGNESSGADISLIPGISTFTYSKDLPATPVVKAPEGVHSLSGCGLVVKWDPVFDPGRIEGFLVFRSTEETGQYLQVSALVKANEFEDRQAARGTEYWYKVQAIDAFGKLSEPSLPRKYTY